MCSLMNGNVLPLVLHWEDWLEKLPSMTGLEEVRAQRREERRRDAADDEELVTAFSAMGVSNARSGEQGGEESSEEEGSEEESGEGEQSGEEDQRGEEEQSGEEEQRGEEEQSGEEEQRGKEEQSGEDAIAEEESELDPTQPAAILFAIIQAAVADGDYLRHAPRVRLLIQREGLRGDQAWGETEAGSASDRVIAAAICNWAREAPIPL